MPINNLSENNKKLCPSHFIQHVRENFEQFLLKLPFKNVFGWSDEYNRELCKTIDAGNSEEIYSIIKEAKINSINVTIGQNIDDGSYASIFNAKMVLDDKAITIDEKNTQKGLDVIVKAAYAPFCDENSPTDMINFNNHCPKGMEYRDSVFMRSMYETIIGIIMHSIFMNIDGVSTPKIYKCGYISSDINLDEKDSLFTEEGTTKYPAIVMAPLKKDGKEIKTLETNNLEKFFLKAAEILKELQKSYHFSHRDLHAGNIRYTPPKNEDDPAHIEIFDFGESCFKWPNSRYALQLPKSENYSISDNNVKECNNPSFDLSMLVLSCYNVRFREYSSDYINKIAIEIFNEINETSKDEINGISWWKLYKRYDLNIESCIPANFIENYKKSHNKKSNNEKNTDENALKF